MELNNIRKSLEKTISLSDDQINFLTQLTNSGNTKEQRYQETLLYGHHSYAPLSKFAREAARKARENKKRKDQIKLLVSKSKRDDLRHEHLQYVLKRKWNEFSQKQFGKKVNDFIFLTLLGIIVALISLSIDIIINKCNTAQMIHLQNLSINIFAKFIIWMMFYITFTCFAVGFTHMVAPTAIGSGIPEVKTMLRGVVLKEYLTFRTLLAKICGLMAALSSGLPIGKEGPFVHIGIIVATIISKMLPAFSSNFENHESIVGDILIPGSAVGLSCTFAAPIGGLLYSLESTSNNFGIKNYWRSFYASAIGTLMYRVISSTFQQTGLNGMGALRETFLSQEKLFVPMEFLAFMLLGVIGGFVGVFFILIHKKTVAIIRHNLLIKKFLQLNRFIYPVIIASIVGILQFPPWLGQYFGGGLTNTNALNDLFSNMTWSNNAETIDQQQILERWMSPVQNIFVTTFLFSIIRLFICAISTTIPFPCGLIFPAFAIGASLGRLYGETMSILFSKIYNSTNVLPAGYALVGSIAFAGAVTQTYSPVVIAVELTGQMGHVLPSLLAVMIANGISRKLTLSIYDCIIKLKNLPYLPIDLTLINKIKTSDTIMNKDLKVLSKESTYGVAANLLMNCAFKSFPIVENLRSMILIGSIERSLLKQVVEDQLSDENKIEYYSSKLKKLTEKSGSLNIDYDTFFQDLEWRNYELMQKIDFDNCPYDEAPFQITPKTTMFKIHNYFSHLNLHHCFVTNYGKLIGIISMKEIRKTIQTQVDFEIVEKKKYKNFF